MIKKIKELVSGLTPQKIIQLYSISKLLTMVITLICGYCLLMSVNPILAQYLLSGNLLIIGNYILYKVK